MRLGTTVIAAALALVASGASCADSSDDDSSSDVTGAAITNVTSALRPAEEVEAAEQASDDASAEFGTPFEVGDMTMLIDGITVVEEPDTEDRPFLVVHVRTENSTDEEQSNPELGIVCAASDAPGSGLAYSTWMPYEALPPDTFRDGFAWLTGPGDPRTGEPTSDCTAPAAIRVRPTTGSAIAVPLGEEIVDALNDDGCAARGTEQMVEETIVSAPVVCASFGDGPKPDTRPL